MLAARIFVGIPEAAFYPGAIYLLSRWYTRKVHFPTRYCAQSLSLIRTHQELAFRSAILYSGVMISNAFGSVGAVMRKS